MKRYLVRISIVTAIAVVGLVAVFEAQRLLQRRDDLKRADLREKIAALRASGQMAPDANGENALVPPDQSTLWGPRSRDAGAPPARTPASASQPPNPPVSATGYSEGDAGAQPAQGAMQYDPNVLQAVSEAELSPTPNDPVANPTEPLPAESVPATESTQSEPTPAEPPQAFQVESASVSPFQNDNPQVPLAPPDEPPATVEPALPLAPNEPPQSLVPGQAVGDPQPVEPAPTDRFGENEPPPLANPGPQDGTGRPGPRELEGVQGASLSVEKLAPAELQVGKTATFQIKVRNTGTADAKEVQVTDTLPKGARLASSNPPAEQLATGELLWNLGRLRSGEETVVSVDIVPLAEGEIGSVATARFAAEASARSIATRPQLTIQLNGPREVLIGQEARFQVRIANVGSGAATGVTLLDQLPPNFTHPAGQEVEYNVGTLGPNESRDVELSLTAVKAGRVEHAIAAFAEGNLRADARVEIEVLAPALDLAIEGSERRFLERQAAYTIKLSNPGTAAAQSIELRAVLPPGLQFVEANNLGEYEVATRTVHWRLDELPAGESGSVTLVTMPSTEGEQKLLTEATAAGGLAVQKDQRVVIEGVAGTSFEVVDASDPIERGGETTYEIRVVNQGTKAATNIQVAVLLPEGMKPVDAQGPCAHVFNGGEVSFEPLPRLAPKADTTYQVRVQALGPGDMRVRVQLLSDEMRTPVTKEESTRVFGGD